MIPTCVTKGLPYGGLQRTCVQGPGLFWGEFFLSSSPSLLGLALNTVFYPSIQLFWGSSGPCEYAWVLPHRSLPSFFSDEINCCLGP